MSIQYRLDDIRCKEGKAKDTANVGGVDPLHGREVPDRAVNFCLNKHSPSKRSGDRLDHGVVDAATGRRPGVCAVRRAGDELVNFGYWGPKWTKTRDSVQDAISRCGDTVLQKELHTLELEWREFATAASAQVEASAEERRVGAVSTPVRPPPTARGEIASIDPPTVTEPRLQIAKAARRARFDGCDLKLTPRSFKLLVILAERAIHGAVPVEKGRLESCLLAGNFSEKAIFCAGLVHRAPTELSQDRPVSRASLYRQFHEIRLRLMAIGLSVSA